MPLYDDDDDGRRRPGVVWLAILAGALIAAGIGWLVLRPGETDDGEESGATLTLDVPTSAPDTSTTEPDSGSDRSSPSTAEGTETDRAEPSEDGESNEGASTAVPAPTAPTTAVPGPDIAPSTNPDPVLTTTPALAPYETLPDGSTAPVIALFDASSVTITGAVPTQDAKDRLQALAGQYAKPGQGNVDNQLTVNPAVPINVGVRVVELTSVRFPDGSAEVLPEHAAELDRVAAVLTALPNVTALVIGHADQRGDEVSNFAVSEQRADAVVNYLVSKGTAPSRLSSRAVGESDLLTLNNDAAALELNRRTEFVLFGLLIG